MQCSLSAGSCELAIYDLIWRRVSSNGIMGGPCELPNNGSLTVETVLGNAAFGRNSRVRRLCTSIARTNRECRERETNGTRIVEVRQDSGQSILLPRRYGHSGWSACRPTERPGRRRVCNACGRHKQFDCLDKRRKVNDRETGAACGWMAGKVRIRARCNIACIER
jgi:hypothetical protein